MSYLEIIEKLKQSGRGIPPTAFATSSGYEKNEINEINYLTPLIEPPASSPVPPRWWEPGTMCWHCQGHGTCRCIVCDVGGVSESSHGPCVVCHGNGKVPERVQ